MTRQFPSYLRLHTAEESVRKPRQNIQLECANDFWRTFASATGWVMERAGSSSTIQLKSTVGVSTLLSADDMDEIPTISHDAALELANTAFRLTEQLAKAEELIRQQEARLAAYEASAFATDGLQTSELSILGDVQTIKHPGSSEVRTQNADRPLADRINEILRSGITVVGASAAGLYTLDDSTSELKLRAAVGLPASRLTEPARSLNSSLADLEALAGGVVTLEDCDLLPAWESPEAFGAAVCMAVEVSGNPVGTLWFWFEQPQQFSQSTKSAVSLTANLVASELTKDTLARRSTKATRAVRPLKSAAAWQQRQQPLHKSPAQGWSLSGWVESPLALASSWYYWDVLPDGMLALVLAEAHGQGYESAMIAATARSAWQAHCGYRHDPAQMLRRISDTLWQTNSGDQLLSCFYAQINPETGEGSMAGAGVISGIIMGRFGFRPLVEDSQPIGANIDIRPRLQHLQLEHAESLFAYTPGLVDRMNGEPAATFLTQHRLAEILRSAGKNDVASDLAAVRKAATDLGKPARDRAILGVARK